MISRIKQELERIDKELEQVHPLLKMLFGKMPGLKSIEYKQGPHENGADFVLSKENDLLDDQEYIGVIVKKDKITKNSHDVNSQIEQCVSLRRFVTGKKEIRLDEIWVVTPKNISNSAQEFFNAKYQSSKIKFLGGDKLAQLIDKFMPSYFEGVPVNVNNYVMRTRERLEVQEKNSHLSLRGFGELNFNQELIAAERIKYKENSHSQNRKRISTNIQALLKKKSAILIEGPMGSGKSTLLRTTAIDMLSPESVGDNAQIPIFLSLKELIDEHQSSLKTLIKNLLEQDDVEGDDFDYIIMLDGVDETKHSSTERAKLIDKIIGEADTEEHITLIMAARKLDETSVKSKLAHSFKSYQIAPLSLKQIIRVLEQTCQSVNLKNRVIEDLKRSDLYRSLPQTPIAAILLARLLNENQHHVPSNLTELYAKYTELALGRWDIDKDLNTTKVYSACSAITKNIARHFIDYDLSAISIQEARQFFSDYLSARQLDLNPKEVFDDLVERSDLFYLDQSRGTFGFKHRTFVEYFYALSMGDQDDRFLDENVFELYWSTIYFFWVGLKKDCPDVLQTLSLIKTSHERTRLLKLINLGNILLAGYESPYGSIETAIREIFLEATDFLLDLYRGNVETRLSSFSKMTLLCIFRYVMADSYGYEFFSSAIDNAMMSIMDDDSIDSEQKATTLFLLNTAQCNPVIDSLFQQLADQELLKQAPITVQLAVTHESRDRNIENEYTKRITRNIKRLTKDRASQQALKELYEMPIKKLTK